MEKPSPPNGDNENRENTDDLKDTDHLDQETSEKQESMRTVLVTDSKSNDENLGISAEVGDITEISEKQDSIRTVLVTDSKSNDDNLDISAEGGDITETSEKQDSIRTILVTDPKSSDENLRISADVGGITELSESERIQNAHEGLEQYTKTAFTAETYSLQNQAGDGFSKLSEENKPAHENVQPFIKTTLSDDTLSSQDKDHLSEKNAIVNVDLKTTVSDSKTASVSTKIECDTEIIKTKDDIETKSDENDVEITMIESNEIITKNKDISRTHSKKIPVESHLQPVILCDSPVGDKLDSSEILTDLPPAKKRKIETEVILIDETSADSRLSGNTDDDVIVVDDGMKENEDGIDKTSGTQECMLYNFSNTPKMITGAWKCYESSRHDNYLRGCKWAPDGTCILANSNDNCLRLFNLPDELYYEGGENKNIQEMVPVLKMKEADTIYDFCWYPQMSSARPETACLAVTSKDTPIHLYDAFTGELRCSYRAYNHVDEVAPAYSLSFNLDGSKLYCGFNKMIRVFDATRPGREFENRPTFAKQGQPGIISCIAHSPTEPGLYAAGSYARAIALYKEPQGEMICMFQGQQGGVTQLAFSPDGTKLYSGGRKDPEILCWDMRNPGQILFTLFRKVETNQRIYFDQTLDGRYLVSGSHDGSVLVWDTQQPPTMLYPDSDPVLKPMSSFSAHNDTVNGVSLHPSLPLLATSSGQRHFPDMYDSDESDQEDNDNDNVVDNSLKLWWWSS